MKICGIAVIHIIHVMKNVKLNIYGEAEHR